MNTSFFTATTAGSLTIKQIELVQNLVDRNVGGATITAIVESMLTPAVGPPPGNGSIGNAGAPPPPAYTRS